MNPNTLPFFAELTSPPVVRALGWTLLHTLWQGAVVAIVLAGCLRALRPTRAAGRYALSAAALLVLPLLAAATFALVYEPALSAGPRLTVVTLASVAPTTTPSAMAPALTWAGTAELTARTTAARLERWLPRLVAAWAVGLGLMLLRLGGGLVVVSRLRRVGIVPVPAAWQARADVLAARLGLHRAVRLLESASVAGPVAVGWLRPAVLLPVGLLAELPPAQLDAILAHELAHIPRHDYLLNIVQATIEALFFFHPAIWWMSAQVRREREHCCDDLAVRALGGDARPLARALAALAEWSAAVPAPAPLPRLSLAATGGELLHRVRRLLVPSPAAAARPGGGAVAGSGAVALALLLTLTLNAVARGPQPVTVASAPAPRATAEAEAIFGETAFPTELLVDNATDCDSTKKRRIEQRVERRLESRAGSRGDAPNLIIVKDRKNRLREVYVDGKKVPQDRVAEYQPYVDEALNEQKEHRREEAAERDLADAREALKEARREARHAGRERDERTDERREERDVHIFLNGPRAEVNGRVIRLDSLERDINDKLERAFSNLDFGNFRLSIADGEENVEIERIAPPPPPPGPPPGNPDGVPPVPPVPPVPGKHPVLPAPPTPVRPATPRAPKTGDAKARQRYDQQMAAYNRQIEAYGKRMDAYGKEMEEYGRQMDEYVQRQARAPRKPLRSGKRSTSIQIGEGHGQHGTRADENRNFQIHGDDVQVGADSNRLGAELRRDGLIGKDDKQYSVQYENGEFRVNGKTQPADVQTKYRKLLNIPENDKGTNIQLQVNE
ncbi:MAG: M56 family metallopeptidase [Hymenobacteraceae bacterium]|nr:M56 family metallopeptidase [Hymenobacteraceae bacterium]